jgi:hypothetical protein
MPSGGILGRPTLALRGSTLFYPHAHESARAAIRDVKPLESKASGVSQGKDGGIVNPRSLELGRPRSETENANPGAKLAFSVWRSSAER